MLRHRGPLTSPEVNSYGGITTSGPRQGHDAATLRWAARPTVTFATLAVTFLLVISDAVGQAGTPQREVEALLAWRENLAGFKLDGDLASWNASSDPCEDWQAVLCADDGIISISLDEQDLQGTVPAEWSALAQLQSVSLRSNRLTGDPIPSSWSVLDRLALINAADNLLTGQLPQQMDAFNVLELYLMNNHLQGPLPEGLGSIQYMALDDNRLSGGLPPWPDVGLVSLKLPGNQLSGPLPQEWSTCAKLKYMELQDNQLSGTLPVQLDLVLSELTVFSISNNTLDEAALFEMAAKQPHGAQWTLTPQREPPRRDPPPSEAVSHPPPPPSPLDTRLFDSTGNQPPSVTGSAGLPQWVLVMIIVLSVLLVLAAAILTVAFVACSKYRRKRDATKIPKPQAFLPSYEELNAVSIDRAPSKSLAPLIAEDGGEQCGAEATISPRRSSKFLELSHSSKQHAQEPLLPRTSSSSSAGVFSRSNSTANRAAWELMPAIGPPPPQAPPVPPVDATLPPAQQEKPVEQVKELPPLSVPKRVITPPPPPPPEVEVPAEPPLEPSPGTEEAAASPHEPAVKHLVKLAPPDEATSVPLAAEPESMLTSSLPPIVSGREKSDGKKSSKGHKKSKKARRDRDKRQTTGGVAWTHPQAHTQPAASKDTDSNSRPEDTATTASDLPPLLSMPAARQDVISTSFFDDASGSPAASPKKPDTTEEDEWADAAAALQAAAPSPPVPPPAPADATDPTPARTSTPALPVGGSFKVNRLDQHLHRKGETERRAQHTAFVPGRAPLRPPPDLSPMPASAPAQPPAPLQQPPRAAVSTPDYNDRRAPITGNFVQGLRAPTPREPHNLDQHPVVHHGSGGGGVGLRSLSGSSSGSSGGEERWLANRPQRVASSSSTLYSPPVQLQQRASHSSFRPPLPSSAGRVSNRPATTTAAELERLNQRLRRNTNDGSSVPPEDLAHIVPMTVQRTVSANEISARRATSGNRSSAAVPLVGEDTTDDSRPTRFTASGRKRGSKGSGRNNS